MDQDQLDTIMRYINIGKKEGAQLVTGLNSKKIVQLNFFSFLGGSQHGDKGYFVKPTVFAKVTNDMQIAREEIFGPVMSVIPFDNEKDLIKKANDSIYGLAAGIITKDIDRAMKLTNSLHAGTVWVHLKISLHI